MDGVCGLNHDAHLGVDVWPDRCRKVVAERGLNDGAAAVAQVDREPLRYGDEVRVDGRDAADDRYVAVRNGVDAAGAAMGLDEGGGEDSRQKARGPFFGSAVTELVPRRSC